MYISEQRERKMSASRGHAAECMHVCTSHGEQCMHVCATTNATQCSFLYVANLVITPTKIGGHCPCTGAIAPTFRMVIHTFITSFVLPTAFTSIANQKDAMYRMYCPTWDRPSTKYLK